MVDRADLIICYVEKEGGAWQAVECARKQGKVVISLTDGHQNYLKFL